ncbi:MAG: hypothetical protein H0W40_19870 [Methylibium sp.]|uniref:hypothetical protein n=1 Tax=Methylibium sp. TaxID=2067992 RepID=UPI0017E3F9F6|nr:hypothetical protein [Methylibium sp.]MBA3599599.1 hypothetical protein [Methylibium sp.]
MNAFQAMTLCAARQMERLAERLGADVRPGHPDYISKKDAALLAASLAAEFTKLADSQDSQTENRAAYACRAACALTEVVPSAAAPDLLKALKGIMDYAATGARVSDVDTSEQPQFVNAYAAIARAEGQV